MVSRTLMIDGASGAAVLQQLSRVGRKTRRPAHRFNLRTRPYQIQPLMIAPVLPGETLTNLLLQSRVVSDPLKNKLGGWWKEYYFFYVKLSDLAERDTLLAMLVAGSAAPAATAADATHYYRGDGFDFVGSCLKRVTECYFRKEDEAWNISTLGGLPLAQIDIQDFSQSLILQSQTDTGEDQLPGENPVIPPQYSAEFANQYSYWMAMRDEGTTVASFEDWLRSFGVRVPRIQQEDPRVPELLRYERKWTYPTNTVEPTTGVPASAAVWSIAERADKARMFDEPGFVFGVTCTRPKVFKAKQQAAAAHYLDTPYMWLPAVLADQEYTSIRGFGATVGPYEAAMSAAYAVDMRDLYIHGDQFVNYDPAAIIGAVDLNAVALPVATAAQNDFIADGSDAAVDGFFAGASPANLIREDGIVTLSIKSRSANVDPTP